MLINSVQSREIEELNADQLTRLLQMLLGLEVQKRDLHGFYYVSRKITTGDGGEDARITVDDTKSSNWVTNKLTLFQCKATSLIPSQVEAELLVTDPATKEKKLKPVLKEVLDNGGHYILFMSVDASTRNGIAKRTEKMMEACQSVGLTYQENQFDVFDANKIAEWASEYISTIAYVLECNGRTRLAVFRTWHQWSLDYQEHLNFKFEDAYLQTQISEIKTLLKTENAIRVIGHSGIGKTRLVHEIFKPDPQNSDTEQNQLNAAVVYYDAALVQDSELEKYIVNFKETTVGIIVIDNCPNERHIVLAGLVRNNSRIKIVSIDFSLETDEKNVIKLSRKIQENTVKSMLKTRYPAFTESEIEHLAQLAEGYPKMVELLEDAVTKNGPNTINTQLPKDFIQKLVFGRRDPNDGDYDVIKSCAIFSEFNFIDDENNDLIQNQARLQELGKHRNFIATSVCNPAINERTFFQTCKKFKDERNILERRGYTLTVVPTPLAANLAADWILNYPPEKFQEFCTSLVDAGLIEAFCKRLRSLDQIERAKSLVEQLWGPQGPFASAEVLNTELGSRLFRSVVEVNPEATVNALATLYSNYTVPEIKAIDKGRRNLIWSLEKLVFRKETYEEASAILAKFAAGETENLGNNATDQFLQTFHVFIPGTEASLMQRLSVLDYCLEESEPEYLDLALNAINESLKSHSFQRMGGAESQGFGTKLIDYVPETWDEIYSYWEETCDRLLTAVQQHPQLIPRAKNIIASNLRGIFGRNQGSLLLPIINYIRHVDSTLWESVMKSLRSALKYEQLDDANRDLANQLIISFEPKDWSNKIRFLVSVPEWDYSDPDMYRNQERVLGILRNLLTELAEQGVTAEQYLPQLLTGEQRRGVLFGRTLAEKVDGQLQTGEQIIDQLRQIDKDKRSAEVLAGFMSAVTRETKKQLVDELIADRDLNYLLFSLLRFGQTETADIVKLFPLLDDHVAHISALIDVIVYVGNGGLSVPDVIGLCRRIEGYGEEGKWTAFTIYHQLSYSNEELWAQFKPYIRNLIIQNNFISMSERHNTMDDFVFTNACERILDEQQDDEFAIAISDQLAEGLKSNDFRGGNSELQDLVQHLMSKYFLIIFERLSPALISKSMEYWNVKQLLGSRNGSFGHSGILFSGDTTKIIEWCEKNKPMGPERIAYMMPVFATEGDGLWHPFARLMIDRFYQVPGLLNEIGANLGSFGWMGSAVPYYEKLSRMMQELFDHKSLKVRKWAKAGYNSYQKQIRLERLNDEQDRIE
ncbi:hypothetical protein LX99_04223 [Mucilaginibacter oryzae]|uniref:Uncharacterized protein n=1 Tax=Mucilaginibacter oryzae TaxID=468058 RepID=A0A316H3L1_9SPHI|nr:hypothetical protein [Mucilaginibacter oryzae]PWK72893.1 hypothetical protein LX99_04223 [Mucilaginibacter oryzae]